MFAIHEIQILKSSEVRQNKICAQCGIAEGNTCPISYIFTSCGRTTERMHTYSEEKGIQASASGHPKSCRPEEKIAPALALGFIVSSPTLGTPMI